MKLSDLISRIGDDKIEFQNLDTCLVSVSSSAKRDTKITFGTSMTAAFEGTTKLGLIVWLDREAVKDALAAKSDNAGAAGISRPMPKPGDKVRVLPCEEGTAADYVGDLVTVVEVLGDIVMFKAHRDEADYDAPLLANEWEFA